MHKVNRFYVLKPEEGVSIGKKWAYGETVTPTNRGDSEKCPICGGHVSLLKWLPPHKITLSSADPSKWGDFLWGAGFLLLVSSHFKSIYEYESLTGISEFYPPVEIIKLGPKYVDGVTVIPPIYHLIEIPWWGANQDDEASNVIREKFEKNFCPYCRVGVRKEKQDRIVIEEDSWDGSDIFRLRGAHVNFVVSERLKEILYAYQLKNLWLIPTEKFAFDSSFTTRPWWVTD